MWTLLVLCSVIATHGVRGASRFQTTEDTTPPNTTPQLSCHSNCGRNLGSCSCASSCQQSGNCCHDYQNSCLETSASPDLHLTYSDSCRYNCGWDVGSCSCKTSCESRGNCCHDYYSLCLSTTMMPATTNWRSCRYNCGSNLGSCSCDYSCQYRGNCCHDYLDYCQWTSTYSPETTTNLPSCRYNCGYNLGSCSCDYSCERRGNCCHDYYSYCPPTTYEPTTDWQSCRYNCGYNLGSCSCDYSCERRGNCCHDYYYYCPTTTTYEPTTDWRSCRNNCGSNLGSCSCDYSCEYRGNCCHDYNYYCYWTTTNNPDYTTHWDSCYYNCGRDLGSCSCSSSCENYGNCCHDYHSYCFFTTTAEPSTGSCGGFLFGSGTFTSPNHPSYYHDNAYCVWQLKAATDHRIYLSFTYLQLENCCSCDYIAVYDGPSVNSNYLGKVCNNSLNSFYSASNYLTVLFRTDSSVVGRGFSAEFSSSLPPRLGQVNCSSDNMNIVIERSYLNSLGYDGNSLYLNNPHCRPRVTTYQVIFNFPIDTCGNVRKFDKGIVVYTNSIRAYASNSGEVTRQSNFKMNVSCRMEQDSVAQILYVVKHEGNISIIGTGRFNTSMAFYKTSSFYSQVTDSPYIVTLNQNLYVQVDLSRRDNLILFLDTCVASPSPDDFQSRPYYLVRNGCPVDNTYYAYITGTRAYAQFTFKAFQFLRATENVYIQCKVLICPASDSNSRCRRGCTKRVARDVGSEHHSQTLVLGPIQLKDPEKKEKETVQQDKA